MNTRRQDLDRFYRLLDDLEHAVGGRRRLGSATGRDGWPTRGVYFVLEAGEHRESGASRVVRVGTHGLKIGSRSTLWGRLRQHRGTRGRGGGKHRGLVFRLHVGQALAAHLNDAGATPLNRPGCDGDHRPRGRPARAPPGRSANARRRGRPASAK